MVFQRTRGRALRTRLIRIGVELACSVLATLAVGADQPFLTIIVLMIAIYLARAVVWLVDLFAFSVGWLIDRRGDAELYADALAAVRLPVGPELRGERDATRSLSLAAQHPQTSREAHAFACHTQGYIEAVHAQFDPVRAAMVNSLVVAGMDRYIDRVAARAGQPGGSRPTAR